MKSSDIITRPATIDDLKAILEIERRAFRKDRFSKRQYIYLLTKANSTIYLIVARKKVAGTAVLLWRRNSRKGRLYNIAVDAGFQKRGLGATLLKACENECRKRNCTTISLEVRSDNEGAMRFYRNHGYETTQILKRYYADGVNGVRMVKRLSR